MRVVKEIASLSGYAWKGASLCMNQPKTCALSVSILPKWVGDLTFFRPFQGSSSDMESPKGILSCYVQVPGIRDSLGCMVKAALPDTTVKKVSLAGIFIILALACFLTKEEKKENKIHNKKFL